MSDIKSDVFGVYFHKYISACVFEINSIRLSVQKKIVWAGIFMRIMNALI
jgi:hypothetical protein